MVAKSRGIRLKKDLDLDDRGHKTLLHVAYLETALSRRQAGDGELDLESPPEKPAPLRSGPADDRQLILRARRRAMARMLREGLEDTLTLLDEALDKSRT